MRTKKYPLDPLARVRAVKVDEAARDLGAAARARAEAARARAEAELRCAEAEAAKRAVEAAEREALGRGELSVADLVRADAWGVRAASENAELARRASAVAAREAEARGAEDAARGAVAARKMEAELVERDRVRWVAEGRRAADAKDEESIAEAWRGKKA